LGDRMRLLKWIKRLFRRRKTICTPASTSTSQIKHVSQPTPPVGVKRKATFKPVSSATDSKKYRKFFRKHQTLFSKQRWRTEAKSE